MKFKSIGPILAILLMSVFLNLWGANHDMPYCYEHDEINFVVTALKVGNGNLDLNYFYHGSFLYYFLFFEYLIFYFIKLFSGHVQTVTDFLFYYLTNPGAFYLIGRVSVAIIGTICIFITYLIGKRLINRTVGLLAALFLSVSPLFVNMAHIIKEETAYILFLLLAFLCTVTAKGRRKMYYAAAFLIGIAISAKYISVFGLIFLFSGFLWANSRITKDKIRAILVMWIFVMAGFFLVEPYALIHLPQFLKALVEFKTFAYDNPVGDAAANVWFIYIVYLKRALGIGIFMAFLVSLAAIFNKNRLKINLLLLPYIGLYYLFVSRGAHPQASFLMGIVPFVCIYTAAFINDSISRYLYPKMRHAFIYAAAGLVLAMPSLIYVLRYNYLLTKPDTRAVAKEWVEKNIPENSSILIEGAFPLEIVHNAPLIENRKCLEDEIEKIKMKGGKGDLWRKRVSLLDGIPVPKYYLEKERYFNKGILKNYNPDYIIVCSYYDHGFKVSRKDRAEFYKELNKRYSLLKQFTARPYIVWFPSFNTLRENPEDIKYVNLLGRNQNLLVGPNLAIYRKKAE